MRGKVPASLIIVILAEFDVWHSRPAVPTRRVAVGEGNLPMDSAPGLGGLLLAGIVAVNAEVLAEELRPGLHDLFQRLESGVSVPQPRLRHRLQEDRIGLTRSTHRLIGGDLNRLEFDLAPLTSPEPQILAALYRSGEEPMPQRRTLFTLLRSATRWRGGNSPDLVDFLTGQESMHSVEQWAKGDPFNWALELLGFEKNLGNPDGRLVRRNFRRLLRGVHPDHGGSAMGAGARIQELKTARNILLGRGEVRR